MKWTVPELLIDSPLDTMVLTPSLNRSMRVSIMPNLRIWFHCALP